MPIPTQKFCIILRGLPGTGKTYIAKKYLSHIAHAFDPVPDPVILSSDDYFITNGVYTFDKYEIQEAYKDTWKKFREEVEKNSPFIIIDNTNIRKFHYLHYLDYATRHNYITVVMITPHLDLNNRELSERNIHNVSQESIRLMRKNFEWGM